MPDLVPLPAASARNCRARRRAAPLDDSQVDHRHRACCGAAPRCRAALVEGPETISTTSLASRTAPPGRRAARRRGARRVRAHRDRDPPGVPPAQGDRHDRGDAVGVRHHADRRHLAAPGRVGGRARTGTGPAPSRSRPSCRGSSPPCSASTTGRRRARSSAAARRLGARAAAEPEDGTAAPAAKGGPLTAPAGRQLLPVPGRHRRHRADRRDHRARRRLHAGRPLHLLLRSRAFRSAR